QHREFTVVEHALTSWHSVVSSANSMRRHRAALCPPRHGINRYLPGFASALTPSGDSPALPAPPTPPESLPRPGGHSHYTPPHASPLQAIRRRRPLRRLAPPETAERPGRPRRTRTGRRDRRRGVLRRGGGLGPRHRHPGGPAGPAAGVRDGPRGLPPRRPTGDPGAPRTGEDRPPAQRLGFDPGGGPPGADRPAEPDPRRGGPGRRARGADLGTRPARGGRRRGVPGGGGPAGAGRRGVRALPPAAARRAPGPPRPRLQGEPDRRTGRLPARPGRGPPLRRHLAGGAPLGPGPVRLAPGTARDALEGGGAGGARLADRPGPGVAAHPGLGALLRRPGAGTAGSCRRTHRFRDRPVPFPALGRSA